MKTVKEKLDIMDDLIISANKVASENTVIRDKISFHLYKNRNNEDVKNKKYLRLVELINEYNVVSQQMVDTLTRMRNVLNKKLMDGSKI